MNQNLQKRDDIKDVGDRPLSNVFASNVYVFTIDQAYTDESTGGAAFLDLALVAEDGRTLKQRIYYTSGRAKGQSITYAAKDKSGKPTGEERYLPGFTLCDELYQVTTGYSLANMKTEEKMVKTWDSEAGKELPQNKDVCMDLKGKKVALAVLEKIIMKQVNKDGNWVDSSETRNMNEVEKAFHAETGQTATELDKDEDAAWVDSWLAKFKDEVIDKTTGSTKSGSKTPVGEKKKISFS